MHIRAESSAIDFASPAKSSTVQNCSEPAIYEASVVQDDIKQGRMYLNITVVLDESEFPEAIHEKAYA